MTRSRRAAAVALTSDLLRGSRHSIAWGMLLGAVLFAFRDVATLGFTGTDGLADFAAARVDGVGDLLRQLAKPVTGGVAGGNANFYRPVTMLHYAMLRGLFGEHALGWQLWDLALHVVVTLLVARLVRRLSGSCARALLAAAIFGLHPLAVEIVPAVARSGDTLMTALALASLLAVANGRALAAGLAGVLALGAKESGIVVAPASLVLWLQLHGRAGWPRLALPWVIGGLVYALARGLVLGGLGGYTDDPMSGLDWTRLSSVVGRAPWEILLPGWSPLLRAAVPNGLRWPGGLGMTLAAGWAAWRAWQHDDRPVLAGLALVLVSLALFALVGVYNRRLLYLAAAGVCIGLASWSLTTGPSRWIARALVLSLLPASPLLHAYTDWAANDRMTRSLTTSVEAELAALSPGTTVWLVDRCVWLDIEPRRVMLWTRSRTLNNCVAPYSIQAWADDRFGERHLEFMQLTYIRPHVPVPPVMLEPIEDGVRVRRGDLGRVVGRRAQLHGFTVARRDEWLEIRRRGGAGGWLLVSSGDGRGRLVALP